MKHITSRLLALLLTLAMIISMMPAVYAAEPDVTTTEDPVIEDTIVEDSTEDSTEDTTVEPAKAVEANLSEGTTEGATANSIDLATFVAWLAENGYSVDGASYTDTNAVVDGKLVVKWSPVSGCLGNNCTQEHAGIEHDSVATNRNVPNKVNSDLAQFYIANNGESTTSATVSISNVKFQYVPADFRLYGNTGNATSATADGVRSGQLYFLNSGNSTFEDCEFDQVVLTTFGATGTTVVRDCRFANVYNSYAIKDIRGENISVTGTTIENCGGGIMVSSTGTVSDVTITGNTFTNVDVDGTAASNKVGTRAILQIASSGTYTGTTFDFGSGETANNATNCGPVVRQMNTGVTFSADDKSALESLVGEGKASGYKTEDTFEPVTPANVAKVGEMSYTSLDEAFGALNSTNHTLELLSADAWNAATPVYWAAGTQSGYVGTLTDALTAAYKANAGDITIVCRPGADVGEMTHGHVADDLTIYGNDAYLSGGECDLEVDTYTFSRETGKQAADGAFLDTKITITAYELDNLGVWGQRNTTYTITVNLTDCDGKAIEGKKNVQRVYISGTSGENDITVTDCDFLTKETALYSNADGTVVIDNCSFTGGQVPVNFNHKANGTQTVTVKNSTFTTCGDDGGWKQFAAPTRFVNSGSGSMTATVESCTFTDTVGNNGDILLGDGRTGQSSNNVNLTVKATAANIQAQKPGYYGGETPDTSLMGKTTTTAESTLTTSVETLTGAATATGVAEVNGVKHESLEAALDAAQAGDTVTLLADTTEDVTITKSITLDLGDKTVTNTNSGKATISVTGGTVTVKNGNVIGGTSYYNIEVTKGSNANLTLEGVTATAGNTGSSMIDNWGTLTIESGDYSGGLDVVKSEEGSTLTINGGKFTLSYATNGYTGVIFAYGTTTITGGEFIQSLTTTGRWNHPTVILTGVVEGYPAITKVTGGIFTNNMSGESIFRGAGKGTSDNFEVSGGTYNKGVDDAYFKEGYFAKKVDGVYTADGPYVARVNSTDGYATLPEAIAAAKAGATVTLLVDTTVTEPIVVGKAITLDLGYKTLTSTWVMPSDASGAGRYALVNNAKMTMQHGTFAVGQARGIGAYAGLKLSGITVTQELTGGHACVAFCKDGATYEIKSSTKISGDYAVANFANNANITISSATLEGKTCGLYHNGTKYGLKLKVNGTTINGSLDGTIGSENDPSGVYISGSASHGTMQNATFTNCTIKGATAIEVKYTDLTLDKCTVEATLKTPSYAKNGDGMTALGFAVVSTDNSKDGETPVPTGTVTITGKGSYKGLVGLGALESVKTNYTGFKDETIKVSGGTFDSAVLPEYCADGYIPEKNADGSYGVKVGAYVAEVNGVKYETLQAAIDAAARNATVTMLADTKENVTISTPYVTLDLKGHTLNGSTGERKPALTITARVTVKDSSEAQTGTIMREDTAGNSGVSSHYVIDVQGAGWLTFESGTVKNGSGAGGTKGASLVRVGDDSVAQYPGLNIKGGTFTQDNFIVIKVDRGDLFLNGGTLNSANSYAVENWHRATIKGGTVNGAVSSWTYSGGSNSDLTISGGTVNGNVESVSYDGSAGKKASVSITGGTVNGTLSTKRYDSATEPSKEMATIEITGGTFSSDPTKYVVEDSAITKNEDGTYGVAKAYLASVGETSYYTMDEAFRAQTASGKPIVLLRDYTTGSTFNSGTINRTVDLNDHTWTCTGTDANSAAFEINNPNVTLTVKNGKIVSSQLVGLIPSAMGGTLTYDDSSLVFDGVQMSTTATSGIETNGNNTNDSVTLKNSTLNVPNGFGIYFPSSGTLTIDNSTITAKTMGVQVCAGSLSINAGSAITVSGDAVPKTENDGAIQDGAAISIVNRDGYKDFGTIAVSGGTFKSNGTNAAIKAYDWNNADKKEETFTESTKVAVSGGTFSSAVPAGLCATGHIPTKNTDGTYGVKEGAYVAEYNGTKYDSLQEAIDAASHQNGGQTVVTLLGNVTITETVTFAKTYSDGSVLLNLGGYTLTGEGCRALQINKGNFYLENGTVTSTGIVDSSSVIRIGSNDEAYTNKVPKLYMRKGAKVLAPDSYGVTIFGSATRGEYLSVSNATIEATGPSPAISGNGGANYNTDDRLSGWKAEEITIGENAVISAANNYAIYHPECGTLNIQGGTITGTGGIQMCSGTLKISNSPKITANGSADYDYTGDAGVVYDAAAISVINRGYPQGPATATIKGTPTVTAANGEVIHAFTWSNSNKTDGEWAEAGDYINVSGGTYNKQFNEAYLAADCTLVTNSAGGYTVEQKPVAEYNGTKYTSLAQAILDANSAGTKATVKLLENVTLTNSLGIGGTAAVTLNLNGKTLTLDGAQIYTQGSAAVTIKKGTIKRTDAPTSGDASNFAIQVMNGSTLLLGGSMIGDKVKLESTYGVYNYGGLLNVQYADITTDGWSIAVHDSLNNIGRVIIGIGGTAKITSQNGNCIGTAVNTKSNVLIHKGTLTSNGTDWDAGPIYWASEGTLTIEGGTFTASTAEGSTAAAVYQKNGAVKISGATTKLLGNNALVVKVGEGSNTETMNTELSGGTYSTKPDESWLAAGKEIHDTTDGMYKVEGAYVVEATLADGTVKYFDAWDKLASVWNASGATIKLLKSTDTANLTSTNGKLTIDFNGNTLTVTKDSSRSDYAAAIVLVDGAELTLKDSVGGGGMTTTNVYGIEVLSGLTVTIESGTYNCDTSVVQVDNGNAYIKGGTFKTEDDDKSYLLNCIDDAFAAKTAVIEVTGGTFYGFDPSANPEGEGTTYVKDGYVSTKNADDSYTVEEYKPIEVWTGYSGTKVASYATIQEAAANLGANKWIIVAKDYTLTESFSFTDGIYLDVAKGATLTVAEGVTITVEADAKRLGVREGAALVNNGTIVVCGSSTSNGFAMLYGTFSGNELTVPEGCFLDNNRLNYFATANADALYEITFGDGTVKRTADSTNITGGNIKQIKLLNDVTGGWTLDNTVYSVGPEVVLDLNTHTLSFGSTISRNATLSVYNKVTIKNGTIKYDGTKRGAIDLVGSGDLTIASDVIIDGGNTYGIFTSGTSKLTVNGTVKANGFYAIAGNGSKTAGNIDSCDITVNEGAVISAPNGIAIYHPELGTVTVNGGTISGHTGIELCAGKLVVSGGSITSTGDNWDATGSQNAILDGAAISIINRDYPGGVPTAVITGGTIKATGTGLTVKAYDYTGNTVAEWSNVSESVNISGGTFSSIPNNMDALCADGFTPVANSNGTYTVVEEATSVVASIGTKKFASLEAAVAAAKDGDTITLLDNVVLTKTLIIKDKTITLDLNGKTISNSTDIWNDVTANDWSLISVRNGGNLTINDTVGGGALKAKENDCYALDVQDADTTLTVNAGTYVGNISAIYAFDGKVTINGGHFSIQQKKTDGDPYRFTLNCYDSNYKAGSAGFTVNGGTFENFDPRNNPAEGAGTSFVAEGVGVDKNTDGTFTAKSGMAAQIVDADGNSVAAYAALSEAVDAVKDGETIKLLANVTLDAAVEVPAGKAVTLDLNGKKLSTDLQPGGTKHYYAIDNYGTFTLLDSSEAQTGEIRARGIENLGSGKMVIKSGKIVAVDNNGGAAIWNLADLTIQGGTFVAEYPGTSNEQFGPGCVYNEGSLTINGGTFTSANKRTYAVVSKSGTVTIDPAEGKTVEISGAHGGVGIDGGTATINGGSYASSEYYGLYVSNDAGVAEVTVTGGVFTGKEYSAFIGSDGSSSVNSTLKIKGGTFNMPIQAQDNTVKGAIQVSGGTFSSEVKPEYCAIGYVPCEHDTVTGKYTVKKGDYEAYYKDGDKVAYGKLDDLLDDEKTAGKTVTLLKDVSLAYLDIDNRTVDLDGNMLTITKILVSVNGHINDSSDGKGLLKIASNKAILASDNGQLPIYDAAKGGYRLFNCWMKDLAQGIGTDSVTIWVRPMFDNTDAYKLLKTGNAHNTVVSFTVRWTNAAGNGSQSFEFPQSMLDKVAADTTGKMACKIVLTGLTTDLTGKITNVKAEGSIVSGTNAGISGTTYDLT